MVDKSWDDSIRCTACSEVMGINNFYKLAEYSTNGVNFNERETKPVPMKEDIYLHAPCYRRILSVSQGIMAVVSTINFFDRE